MQVKFDKIKKDPLTTEENKNYVIGVDFGNGKDYTVVIDLKTLKPISVYETNNYEVV